MGKPKKSKKKDFASDEDESPRMIENDGGAQDNGGDEEEEGLVEGIPQAGKSKKQSKKKAKKQLKSRFDVDSDDEDGEEEPELNGISGEVHVKSKKATGFAALMDSDGDEEPVISSGRRQKNKGGFSALMMEESDEEVSQVRMSGDETSTAAEPSTAAKKKDKKKGKEKKKKKKAQGFDDDADLERMLSELSVEYTGDKPAQATTQSAEETSVVKEPPAEVTEAVEQKSVAEDKEVAEGDEEEDDVDDEFGTVKTKAQKRKEKKERDRLKKVTQKQKETRGDKSVKSEELSEKPAPAAEEESQEVTKEATSKKKKKKAAVQPKEEPVTVQEDEPKKKKGPGKKLVAAMQEALRQQQEAEERAKREEEDRIRREEEADRMRKEALEREKEMKELKKKQAKERRDQLKSEGKLLTPKQKQNLARAQAMLDAMKQQGAQVGPSAQKARPSAKDIRKQRKKPQTDVSSDQARTIEDVAAEEKSVTAGKVLEEVKQEGDEKMVPGNGEVAESWDADIKDSWDQASDAEEEPSVSTTTADEDKSTGVDAGRGVKDAGSAGEEGSTSSEDEDESDSDEEEEFSSSSDDEDERTEAEKRRDRVVERLDRRRKEARDRMSAGCLRAPVICVLGHVDTGKTKILDKLRRTNVQEGEAGGITQQIGATNVPLKSIEEQQRQVKSHKVDKLKIPGLLIIDTPGHESFSNLRSRGSSLCDLAILVVDIMHGLEPQTIESINLLKTKRTPFVVALNKIDRLYDWETGKGRDVEDVIKAQERHTQIEFEKRSQEAITQLAEQGLNAKLFYENDNPREYLSVVPTSAITGEGMANLMSLVVMLTQNMLTKRLMYSDELQATVLEVKQIPGLGTTVDVILVNGTLREGSTVVLAGTDGPIVTQIRSLLMPQPLKELRVKNAYQEFKEIRAAQGVKIAAKDLEKAIAGLNLLVAEQPDEIEICRAVVNNELRSALRSIRLSDRGVLVQASTLGSLEALLEFLRTSKIAYSGVRIGPVVKRDVMKASTQLQHDAEFACILAFDVKVERDAQEMADNLSVKIFQADIIYHLFDRFVEYKEQLKQRRREQHKHVAVFPCKVRVLPQFVFNSRDPIVAGVSIEGGIVRVGTPICVPSKEFLHVGFVSSIEQNHKQVDSARKGAEVCIKIDPVPGESPKMFGRHFDETDILVSRISRESIDACKNYFRDDLLKADWQLMIELKKMFQII